ncbi:MAG TPA: aldo/keto reductase [Streptosporangiaceae bacterium]|nr:aldo/keto reductase [Streptosporangiaceae bacterium]
MRYTTIGSDPLSARKVSVLSLGAMRFGTTTDEATSFAILDRYAAAGGNFIDTSNNYLFFVNGTQGGESEALLGRWRASRGIGDEIVIATKVGARPIAPAADFGTPREGLSRAAIREASERSREHLGVERLDLYYAHIPDQTGAPLEEQVAAFGELVADGAVGLLGLSNHWAWQVERARGLAAAAGSARADVLQYHHTYLRMRTDIPDLRFSRDGEIGVADGSILSYLRAEPGMTLVAYSPLLNGAYACPGKKLDRAYDHPGTGARIEALDRVAKETGATASQVVLAWLTGGELPVVALIGASSVAQLEESLAGIGLQLTAEQRQLLDAAN